MLPNYYTILGLDRSASQLQIKAAYRHLVKQHHPDKHKGDTNKEAILQRINEAYEVLSDLDKKTAYDKQLELQLNPPSHEESSYAQAAPLKKNQRNSPYVTYVYSKWTLMYGKIFIILPDHVCCSIPNKSSIFCLCV